MTTEGGVGYRDLLMMDQKEMMWWYQKCVDHNEAVQEKMDQLKRKK